LCQYLTGVEKGNEIGERTKIISVEGSIDLNQRALK